MRFFKSHKGLWDGWNSGFAVFYEKVPFQWLTFIGIEGVGGGGEWGQIYQKDFHWRIFGYAR